MPGPRQPGEPGSLEEVEANLIQELRELTEALLHDQEKTVRQFTRQALKVQEFAPCASTSPPVDCCNTTVSAGFGNMQTLDTVTADKNVAAVTEDLNERLYGGESGSGEITESALAAFKNAPSASKIFQNPFNAPAELNDTMEKIRNWIEEPERKSRLAQIVHGYYFELMTLVVIALNGGLVIYQTNQDAREAFAAQSGSDTTATWEQVAVIFEYCFLGYFLVELCMRLAVHGGYYFINNDMWWNIFDAAAITAAIVDIVINLVGNGTASLNIAFLRVLRVFRMTRGLRVVRALKFIRSLRQLVDCIITSFSGLFWCMVLLVFLTGIFSVFLVQCATFWWQDSLQEDNIVQNLDGSESMAEAFGSVQVAMLSLFKATSGGEDWGFYYSLMQITGSIGPSILIVYILFFMIAAWNIVTSLFVEKALALAQPDVEARMMMQIKQNRTDAKDLLKLLKSIDDDQSGTISITEFNKWMCEPRFKQFLEVKGVDIKDAELFFHMLEAATHHKEIETSVVVNGLMRMRGIATNLDLHALNFTVSNVYNLFERHLKEVRRDLKNIKSSIHAPVPVVGYPAKI